jgi:hypothetical protein
MNTTQGRELIARLKRKPHTYLDMLGYCISTSPWKRVLETLLPGEQIVKGSRRCGGKKLTTWRVVVK